MKTESVHELGNIVLPNNPHHPTAYSSKADIERACLWENCRRFNQASHTPPMTTPLFSELGRMGTGPLVGSILRGEGNLGLTGVDPWARKLLKHFQYLEKGRRWFIRRM